MREVVVSLRDLGVLERQLGARLRLAQRWATNELAASTRNLMQRQTLAAPPASRGGKIGAVGATRRYYKGWRFARDANSARVYNDSPHAVFVELGRRAGRPPPVAAILPWVRKVLRVPAREARGVAFIIARAIGRRGLRPRFILTRALPTISRMCEETYRRYYEAALNGARAR